MRDTPKDFHDLAEELRNCADQMMSGEARRTLLRLADEYERRFAASAAAIHRSAELLRAVAGVTA